MRKKNLMRTDHSLSMLLMQRCAILYTVLMLSFIGCFIYTTHAQNITDDDTTNTAIDNNTDDGNGNQRNRNLDRFNYDSTTQDSIHYNFGPEDWGEIVCPDLDTCVRSFLYILCFHFWVKEEKDETLLTIFVTGNIFFLVLFHHI
jgi:hypothetical protein